MPVEKTRESKRPERQIPSGHRFSKKKTTTAPRSCLRWKQTGRILKTVGLRWVPTGKLFNSCTGKVESEPTHGSNVDIPYIQNSGFKCRNQCQNGFTKDELHQMVSAENNTSGPVPQCLVLHQMTSDHNRSELGILVNSNEPSSSKLVPKVVPLAVKIATSRQELELLFHHHIALLRTTHPSDTNVFTMKMEILLEPASNKLLDMRMEDTFLMACNIDVESCSKLRESHEVQIMQISQENSQNRTNTDTGTDKVFKSRGFDSKKGQKSTPVNL
ncbi:hypothetical protein Tco_1151865 [Tanacetum coccineum]